MMHQKQKNLRFGLGVMVLASLLAMITVAMPATADNAEQIVAAMIEAHGEMEGWANAPTVSFIDEFRQGEAESGNPSRVTVEQGARRAYIDILGTEMRISWDGEKAWSENWQAPTPPRFLALLNYHFLNLPWLAADPGVILGKPGTGKLAGDPTEYITIKLTYEGGVGDTPDDYYILYIDPKTHRLKATEYIVTYSAILPEGVTATEPHVLVYDDFETVDGLMVPTHYTIYEGEAIYGRCPIRDWSFSRPFDEARMILPEGAVVDESQP